jgi:ABC-type glycerol-3-phosphate transport system substrate-binding protein
MTFNKTLIAIALASTLSACGSSSSDSDTTAPTITISGSSSITIDFNQAYVDAGATAIDDVDGAIAELQQAR